MNNKYFVLALSAALMVAACNTEEDIALSNGSANNETSISQEAGVPVALSFKAGYSSDGVSKTALSGTKELLFSAGDQILVSNGSSQDYFVSDIESGTAATCNFTGELAKASSYKAVYPYSCYEPKLEGYCLPSMQYAVAGSFDPQAHIMTATSTSDDMSFSFVTANSFIKFVAPCNLSYVVLYANNGEYLSGAFGVSVDNKSISGGSEEGVMLQGPLEKDKVYYISVLPTVLSGGISFQMISDNSEGVYVVENSIELKANHVKKMKDLSSVVFAAQMESSELDSYLQGKTGTVNVKLTDYNESVIAAALKNNSGVMVNLSIGMVKTNAIGDEAFKGCSNLVSITLMPFCQRIGQEAFANCTNLKTVNFNAIINDIDYSAFEGCTQLEDLSIPSSVQNWGDYSFSNGHLTKIMTPFAIKTVDLASTQKCSMLKDIIILGNPMVTAEGVSLASDVKLWVNKDTYDAYHEKFSNMQALVACDNLETALSSQSVIYLADYKTGIGDVLRANSSARVTLILPDNVENLSIESLGASMCLSSVVIPGNVASIPQQAFSDCKNLESVTLEDGVEKIGNYAFEGCASLKLVKIQGTLSSMGSEVFGKCYSGLKVWVDEDTYGDYSEDYPQMISAY